MVFVGIWLAAVGAGDLVAGLNGTISSRRRALAGWLIAAGVGGVGTSVAGAPATTVSLMVVLVLLSSGAWLWARPPREWSPRHASTVLIGVGIAISCVIATSGAWPDVDPGVIQRWLASLPFEATQRVDASALFGFAGALAFLQATSNALVRLVLRVAGAAPNSEHDLRGGRIIGPLERTLIFGLALAGEPTAAALVISAKGLLRFPEISKEDKDRLHDVTEYFLVGSLTSWLLALGSAALVLLDPV